ncbi:hypothetical protein KAW38_00960 [Candidatus Micrarchaeota archaeon]|nr:hypothetical protein [Candidatus Micrarchaeota archaeon]
MLKQEEQQIVPRLKKFKRDEAVVPLPHERYSFLEEGHKESLIYSYIPVLRYKFNGEFEQVLNLEKDDRFAVYEGVILGVHSSIVEGINKIKKKKTRGRRKITRDEIISLILSNPKIKAEDLIGKVPPSLFSRLMLFVKYRANNQESLLEFLKK